MSPGIRIAYEIVLQAVLITLFLGSLFALVFGASMMLGNRWVYRLNERTKRWISTREAMRPMDVPHSIETQLHRWHLAVGVVLACGGAFILYAALFHYDAKAIAHVFQPRASVWAESMVQAGWWLAMVAGLAGLVVGVLLMAKPALLQSAEAWANRAYSGRRATKPFEMMNFSPDRWVTSSPRASGAVIAIGSIYIAFVLGQFLLAGR